MKSFLVDTLTTVVFFTLIAAATELLIVGLTPAQTLTARAITVPVMIATARPYGLWRGAVLSRLDPRPGWRTALADTAAFVGFQAPVYAATLALAGAEPAQILQALAAAVAGMLVVGRPFGLILDRVRRACGTAPDRPTPAFRPPRTGL